MTSGGNLYLQEGMKNPGDDKYVGKYKRFLIFSFLIFFKQYMTGDPGWPSQLGV